MVVLFSGGSLLLGQPERRCVVVCFQATEQICAHGRALLAEPGEVTSLQICAKVMFEYMHRTESAKQHVGLA